MGRACSRNGGEDEYIYTILGGIQKERDPRKIKTLVVNNIEMDLKQVGVVWIGLIWLRTGTGGGLL
jgi:hypothetical protein